MGQDPVVVLFRMDAARLKMAPRSWRLVVPYAERDLEELFWREGCRWLCDVG